MKRTASLVVMLALAAALVCASVYSALATPVPIGPDGFTPPAGLKVAVVYSQTTIDWANRRGTPGRYPHASKEQALVYYLRCRGYDVTEIVGDRDLVNTANLKQFNVIVLNSMYGMGYQAAESLARYVQQGGGLVASIGSPRVNPAFAPRPGVKDNLNEWWWRVMHEHGGLHYWEWGPLSSLYQEQFVNDGPYTPEWVLKPNAASPIVQQAQTILSARGLASDVSGVTLHHPHANIEMSQRLSGATDATSAADFQILTPSVKKLYPKTYTAIQSSLYGAGRTVKFDYGATDFLQNYSNALYDPATPTGVHQGEVAGALVEAAIIWAGSADGSVAHSVDGTTYANVSSAGGKVSATQYATNAGDTLTKASVRFAVYSASGKCLKAFSKGNVYFMPHQTRSYSWKWSHALPAGTCKVVASFTFGYPGSGVTASTQSAIVRGQKVRTH
jgi:hypothetical protein